MPGYMVVYEDRDGTPVAWHTAPEEMVAKCTARELLAKHVSELRSVGFDITANDFRLVRCREVTP